MPIAVTPFGRAAPGSGRILARSRVASSPPLDFGNASGWANLAAVLSAIKAGNTYVNVHTNDGVNPANTGAGDFPGGEIRGQIRMRGGD